MQRLHCSWFVIAFVVATGCGPAAKKTRTTTPPPAAGTSAPDAGTQAAPGHTPDAGTDVPDLPRVVKTPGRVVDVVVGYRHVCALMSTGRVRCWGYGGMGALGTASTTTIGDDEPARAGDAASLRGRMSSVTAGMHTCAVGEGGAVQCWGDGRFGRLGYGNTSNIGDDETPHTAGAVAVGGKVVQVAAGEAHTCVVVADGRVKCWGRGSEGRLGQGNQDNIGDDETPASVPFVKLGGAAAKVYAGGDHSCALMRDGSVRCWGANRYGQLGYGHSDNIGDDETPDTAGAVKVGGKAVALALGGNHTCALLEGGSVRCWGWGGYGQLGYGKRRDVGDTETPAKVGDVAVGARATAIAAGNDHTCVLTDAGAVRCWGQGLFGALGLGNTNDVGDNELPSKASAVSLGGKAAGIAAGGMVTCARMASGTLTCWGNGVGGMLGRGNVAIIGDDEVPSAVGPVPIP